MPYEVKEHNAEKCDELGDAGFDVVNKATEEVKDHHDDKPAADRQVRILSELEKDAE